MPETAAKGGYGTRAEAMLKFDKLPPRLRARINDAKCFLNINALWDYYHARGLDATIAQIERDEYETFRNRSAEEKFQVYDCGHRHESFAEAQTCFKWLVQSRNQ